MQTVIHWFRNDLRLDDNPALYEASQNGEVLPIYIIDENIPEKYRIGAASKVWLHHSLKSLNKSLNNKLVIFVGDPEEIIIKITSKYKIKEVYWNLCYEPWEIDRDKKIKQRLKENSIKSSSFNGYLLWEPWKILKEDGQPYRVFTPFYKKAYNERKDLRTILPEIKNIKLADINDISDMSIDALKLLPKISWDKGTIAHWQPGEEGAQKKLAEFLQAGIDNYKEGRNFPAKKNNSQLAPHIHFGEISVNKIWHIARLKESNADLEHFCSELGWREFSYHLLYHFPNLVEENLQKKFDKFPWQEDIKLLQLWQKGQTGYPIVDAGMKQLWQTGYMHNRVRMIVASFLVKNLLIHWHHGQKWFWDCLFDADLANNSCSWQWVAGSGADAAPYFRIFNPILQGQKFDPNGEYIKKYLPQLAKLPNKYLFNPIEAPEEILKKSNIKLGVDYPKPIIDLKFSRDFALSAYEKIR